MKITYLENQMVRTELSLAGWLCGEVGWHLIMSKGTQRLSFPTVKPGLFPVNKGRGFKLQRDTLKLNTGVAFLQGPFNTVQILLCSLTPKPGSLLILPQARVLTTLATDSLNPTHLEAKCMYPFLQEALDNRHCWLPVILV